MAFIGIESFHCAPSAPEGDFQIQLQKELQRRKKLNGSFASMTARFYLITFIVMIILSKIHGEVFPASSPHREILMFHLHSSYAFGAVRLENRKVFGFFASFCFFTSFALALTNWIVMRLALIASLKFQSYRSCWTCTRWQLTQNHFPTLKFSIKKSENYAKQKSSQFTPTDS